MNERTRQRKSKVSEVERGDRMTGRGARDRSKPSKWYKSKRTVVGMMFGLSVLAVLAFFGPSAVYERGSDLHQNVVRFLSSVTSRGSVGDHQDGSQVYAIMMDAGSTGSRILVFTFNKSPTDGSLKLAKEFYKEIKPGISSYHENPAQAADTIRGLFDDAKALIPKEKWSETPASLKATAGLRLLPGDKAENLLKSIREVFATSGFLTRPDSVEIINGTSEGLYCWTTINFLLDKLHRDLSDTVAIVDMGGGSMQLALVPMEPSTVNAAAAGDVSTITVIGRQVQFYIRSYLGMGLMAVRLSLLQRSNSTNHPDSLQFISPFFEDGMRVNWEFQGKRFSIQGARQSVTSSSEEAVQPSAYLLCRQMVSQIIAESGLRKIKELQKRHMFAISYFFDRAVEALLIDERTGGSIRVQDFCRTARTACEVPDYNHPFACIDFTYFCTLLEDGFGLTFDQVLNLKKKIDGHETSWALGAALSDLDQQAKRKFV